MFRMRKALRGFQRIKTCQNMHDIGKDMDD